MNNIEKPPLKKWAKKNVLTRLLCIDPALSTCGWSIIDFKHRIPNKTPLLKVVRFGGITPTKEISKVFYKEEVGRYSKRIMSLVYLREQVSALIEEYEPEYVVIEDTYCHRFPTTYAALEQCIATITIMCKDRYNVQCFRVPTKSAKLSITGNGGASKIDVINSILSNDHISFKQRAKLDALSDHEADSIAVGYYFLTNVWQNIKQSQELVYAEE